MPELPEVETVMRGLRLPLEGHILTRVEQRRDKLRFPLPERFAERLQGRRVQGLRRRAKFILIDLDDEMTWMIHLGMSGRIFIEEQPARIANKHDHVIVETDGGKVIFYEDHRRFGLMDLFPTEAGDIHPMLKDLGPEPLGNSFHVDALNRALVGRKTPIKSALLDQHVVAGLGNIYVCEALWRAKISPKRMAKSIPGKRSERLVPHIRAVLNDAIVAGGSSLRDYVQASGELGYFQHQFAAYGREGEECKSCGKIIKRIVQSGRSTFYCSSCQR
jgi:formamidopyrimidine-DNA glycosylase